MDAMVVQVAQRGVITLPKRLREAYGLQPGDTLSVVDLGGAFLLYPGRSEVEEIASRIGAELAAQGETLESMLQALREERARYET
jgi:AbrB family looped-hinge helix DNA binding protein